MENITSYIDAGDLRIKVEIEYTPVPAEPDLGLRAGIEIHSVIDPTTGDDLINDLTDAEYLDLIDRIWSEA